MRGEKLLSSLVPSSKFLAPLPGTPIFKIGELHTMFYLCFLVLLVYLIVFILVSFIKNHKKIIDLSLFSQYVKVLCLWFCSRRGDSHLQTKRWRKSERCLV